MNHTFKIFTLILLIAVTKSYSQAIEYDTVYSSPDTMPMYKDGDNGLSQYFTKELAPIIGACIKRDTTIIASLCIVLTIDSNGKVIEATFPTHNLTTLCKDDLKKKLFTMNGWRAGQKEGRPVCSIFNWPIRCIKWE